MKILLVTASFSSHLSGVQRHAFNLARSLLTHTEVSGVHLVLAPWQRELVRGSGLEPNVRLSVHVAWMKPNSLSRNLWYYKKLKLPLMAAQLGIDLVHLAYPVPVNARAFTCPIVVSLHDLYPYEIPSNFGFPKALFNRIILQQCLRGVDAIACVSEITRLRLSSYVPPCVARKALRIYNCVEAESQCADESAIHDWKGEQFFLCVAQHRRNKNILFLLSVFGHLMRQKWIDPATRLLIVGMPGPETYRIQRAIKRAGLGQNILLMEGLSESQLQWCYRKCAVVLAPSTVEGFGLPVAEALLAGARVVCSDIPAFREIGGDWCRYVPLGKSMEDAFAKAILALMQEPHGGSVSFPRLSASVIAEQYVSLYRGLLTSAGERHCLVSSASIHRAVSEGQSI
jgi:glycosyltransferase involved in cell wall biosynthesis